MRALNRKLFRDLWGMRGQALAIALVMASGVATYIMSASTLDSLRLTRSTFYRQYRFADVFASLKRAPESLEARIAAIPGVDKVETRVAADVRLEVEGFPDPVTARLVSAPEAGGPLLNALYIRKGRYIEPGRQDEVLASEAFAEAHGLEPGDSLEAVINGKRKRLVVVGVALSPEFIYQLSPGAVFPDFKRYGILWMGRKPLAAAYDMEGAFNDVVLSVSAGARVPDVVDRLDAVLARYGGLGAYGREYQTSHRYLSEEFRQLGQMAAVFPAIFLGVAAFLLNIVVSRLISTQREQIAVLKAFGYSNMDVGIHYAAMVMMVAVLGVAGGIAAGVWLGKGLSGIYMDYYRFPYLKFELRMPVAVTAGLISSAAALVGTAFAVRRAALLPPAEAMRPEPPARYRESLVERLGLKGLISQPGRMIARHLERRPAKTALSIIGISLACAIMMVGSLFRDAVNFMAEVHFDLTQRQDLTVTFVEPASRKALYELVSLRGVERGEPFRSVPARLRFEHRSYRTSVQGFEPGGTLHRLLDRSLEPFELPPEGILLTDYLADMLGVSPGQSLTVEALEGSRPVREVPVAGTVSEYVGVSGYMRLSELNRLMGEGDAISGAYLAADRLYRPEVYAKLHDMPRVAGTVVRESAIENFYSTMDRQVLIFAFFNTLLAATIAFGVVYNSARIALSERSRELASLRVLGFTRGEISYILLGELGLLTLAAIPLGFVIGRGLCAVMISKMQTDLFRVPLVLEPRTYAFSAAVVLVSAAVSGLIVRRRLDRLDLVGVLKTKE
ncbi:MAG: ABC transporter permease [Thermodesulfovibrionales bacterium]